MKPDYYLVLPWHFADEFLEREKALLESGVGMIFPLPEIKIVQVLADRNPVLPRIKSLSPQPASMMTAEAPSTR
jgi:hypothetical protein